MTDVLANRSAKDRRKLDYYPTPPEVTHVLMRFLELPQTTVWECACGEGHMAEVIAGATAYELSWYLQKNPVPRTKLNGDAGAELQRLIKATGINFTCPPFGFMVKDRISPQSFTSLFTSLTEQAYEKTGFRYFVQHQRDKLNVLPEGQNSVVPMFKASMLESSSTG